MVGVIQDSKSGENGVVSSTNDDQVIDVGCIMRDFRIDLAWGRALASSSSRDARACAHTNFRVSQQCVHTVSDLFIALHGDLKRCTIKLTHC